MLNLEEKRLSDFIDFSKVMIQKYDKVLVQNCYLVLKRNNEVIKLNIRGNFNLIKR